MVSATRTLTIAGSFGRSAVDDQAKYRPLDVVQAVDGRHKDRDKSSTTRVEASSRVLLGRGFNSRRLHLSRAASRETGSPVPLQGGIGALPYTSGS